MSRKLRLAGAISVAATLIAILASAEGSGAAAQDYTQPATSSEPHFISMPVVQPLPDAQTGDDASLQGDEDVAADDDAAQPATLAELVSETPLPESISKQMRCLAGAVYFEAKGETLAGQLAVARVVINRTRSNRFPDSFCGVVLQRAQFAFVRHGAIPPIRTESAAWSRAVRIAQIATDDAWSSPVEGALFFHAARVSPGWHRERVARIDHHIFYR